jgi:transposase-like protein
VDGASVQLSLPIAEILAGLSDQVEALGAEAGLLVIQALLDEEVERRAGVRYHHAEGRSAVRWGRDEGYVTYAGRKVPIERPRVRSADGREVGLERYALFQKNGRLERAVAQRVVRGVTMRDYEGVIDDVCDGYGIRKSSVSRHWKTASAAQLAQLLERPLSQLDLVAILIDGIEFHDFLLVVALGIDSGGRKHVLGLWPGASENAEVSKALLEDLVRRGLATDRKYLFVLDGSKALRKAVEACFGQRAQVQRCQVHKERNVLAHLPEAYHASVRQRLRAAWGLRRHEEAQRSLAKLVGYLEELSPSAAASLREGLEETLTLHRLGVPELLRRTLDSTNPIESCFSRARKLCGNVTRWRSQEMAQRWAGAMLLEAEKRFKRVKGYREMAVLIQALRGKQPQETAA